MNADTPKRKNLGRGLNALFGEQDDVSPSADSDSSAAPGADAPTNHLPIDLLTPSPLQPRRRFDPTALDELASSIAEKGVLQPLLVRPDPSNAGRYEIIAGERRWRASQLAQVHDVPVHIVELSDAEVLEVALIENLQRQDLSPVEEARGYRKLLDEFGHTQERVAQVVGKSRTHVANLIRLLSLPEAVQALLDSGEISVGQARPLIGLDGAEALAGKIVKRGLSARQVERLAKGFGSRRRSQPHAKDADTAALEKNLEQATGYTVKIAFDGKGGSVSVAYSSLEQLDDIVRRLSSGGRIKSKQPATESTYPTGDMTSATDDHSSAYPDPGEQHDG
jgi:ParB family transcriptional regulator, chromosome partitioning protein